MRKSIFALLAVAALAFTACGGEQKSAPEAAAPADTLTAVTTDTLAAQPTEGDAAADTPAADAKSQAQRQVSTPASKSQPQPKPQSDVAVDKAKTPAANTQCTGDCANCHKCDQPQ